MRFGNKAAVAAGLGFTAAAVVGCGSSGNLLSSAQATQLRAQLTKASTALADGDCSGAAGYISNFQTKVDELGSVNQTLASNLQAGAAKIEQLASKECPVQTTPEPTHTKTTQKSPPKTTPTVTTVTQTVTTTASTTTQAQTDTGTTTTQTQTQTQTDTGTTSTQTYTNPGNGLTGTSTSTTPTTSTQYTSPTSGGTPLSGGTENGQRRGFDGSSLPPGWQHRQDPPGAAHWQPQEGGS
jgi:hypothetical protein